MVDVQIANELMGHTTSLLGLVHKLLYFPINRAHLGIDP